MNARVSGTLKFGIYTEKLSEVVEWWKKYSA